MALSLDHPVTVATIGANTLKADISKHCGKEVRQILKLLENETFYIHIERATGKPDHKTDQQKVSEIRLADPTKYGAAILTLIYKTRCNMFHGTKQFSHVQIQLLQPMNAVLERVIKNLRAALRGEP